MLATDLDLRELLDFEASGGIIRFAGERAPKLRAAVARERVRIAWAGRQDAARLAAALEAFRADLGSLPADARATLVPPKREQRLDASA